MGALNMIQLPSLHLATFSSFISPSFSQSSLKTLTPTRRSITRSSSLKSFLDLTPEYKPQSLNIDLERHDFTGGSPDYDAVIIGCGPSGLRLASLASKHGLRICCLDPSPLLLWPNNYGVWVDEFEAMNLTDTLDKVWPSATVIINDQKSKHLDRPYGRVNRNYLKSKLIQACVSNGVKFHVAKACKVEHQEFKSTVLCSDGKELNASLVIDASGFTTSFMEYENTLKRNHGYQLAHGILAEVEHHPFELDKMVLMDWRDDHLGNEPYLRARNKTTPTFLYAMPLSSGLIFLEETSLVSRPVMSYREVKQRMVARLRHLGIKVKSVVEDEKCLIPMGGPLPRLPQSVVGVGGASGLVHPSTGYMVARALGTAELMAEAMVECLGSVRMVRGKALQRKVWTSVWSGERMREREFYCFGMETLLQLGLKGTRSFFDAFFDLDPYYWHGFLSSRLSLQELALLSFSLFAHASLPSRMDIITKCPLPLARLVANLAANQAI
ncbi:capsanthin/capsorubin synthase protein [Dioscorea alata]|uniref:Capsanthin/capsorubin synthase protein n=1 Tax=Dioscorea alata TaxID=55571 RepID=A0ACB7VCV1_DIOAL|nr:capsanthin/capsorubin synthase protein [Dioscorea alata]